MGTTPSERLSPSMLTARRAAQGGSPQQNRERAYPLDSGYDDHLALQAQLSATRALLTATTPEQVAAILATLVHDLGGGVVPARLAEGSAMPLDVSLGTGEPVLPWAEPVSVAEMRLSTALPPVVEDARLVLQRLQTEQRQAQEAEVDQLTGLLTRRAWMRRLSSAGEGAGVALIDLDDFKEVNDTAGHAAGDAVLRDVGLLLRQHFRDDDACGRYGGDELVCLTPGMADEALAARLDAVRAAWVSSRAGTGQRVGLSMGVAAVGPAGPRAALQAADQALYQAKSSGRDRTRIAGQAEPGPAA